MGREPGLRPKHAKATLLKLGVIASLAAPAFLAGFGESAVGYAHGSIVTYSYVRTSQLNGTYDTLFQGVTTKGQARISASSLARRAWCRLPPNSTSCPIKLENQNGETAYGSYASQEIKVTAGSWPDATVEHPLIGTVTLSGADKVVIQWGQLDKGRGSGGTWTSTHVVK
jgi:hypothetical protein